MSDWYLALVDTHADSANADALGERLLNGLISEKIILPETSSKCVYGGIGYLPGPRLKDCYDFADNELPYWDMLSICGVEIHTGKWVNEFGFIVFEWARCPACGQTCTIPMTNSLLTSWMRSESSTARISRQW